MQSEAIRPFCQGFAVLTQQAYLPLQVVARHGDSEQRPARVPPPPGDPPSPTLGGGGWGVAALGGGSVPTTAAAGAGWRAGWLADDATWLRAAAVDWGSQPGW